ncbi:L-threonylcarbamoyladenylate synthase [Novosphingobium sp. 9]|uniref:L-threonylcarbamoyladenylate synthase n=1 Tax=Novosphingobium sp. 9 TaxID=2025349 RepID=UPI0021B6B7F3|nr:L-threonylcarbamoyladenylate synthase [Novosphingobium sp. 9]
MNQTDAPRLLPDTPEGLQDAAVILRGGGLVAVPTETVYGLAGRADRDETVAAIYRAKGRPSFNPLIVHVSDFAQAETVAVFDERARALAHAFWPGPLTMVLPLRDGAPVAPAVTAGLPTVALRCPGHPTMRELIARCGVPLAAPSANASGGVSPSCAAHVVASLGGRIDAVIDGGACPAGLESTIVALRGEGAWQLLRPGPLTVEALAEVLGCDPVPVTSHEIEAPGQLASHYAPGKPVRLEAEVAEADEFHIGYGAISGDATLSADADLAEAAARLYALLHEAAAAPQPRIAVAPIPDVGIGLAINDRLRRAAA